MKCPSCGFENEAGVHFCGSCGTKMPEEPPQTPSGKLVCPNCGQENPPDARFCQDCGQAMIGGEQKREIPSQPIPQTPPPLPVVKKGMPSWVWTLLSLLVVAILFEIYWFFARQDAQVSSNPSNTVSNAAPASDSKNCRTGETLLYREDFEDGTANGWGPGPATSTPGISIAPAPDDKNNKVLTIQRSDSVTGDVIDTRLEGYDFKNAVLRIRFLVNVPLQGEKNWFSFNWLSANQPFDLQGQSVFDSRYQLPIGYNYFEMRRLQQPVTNVSVARSGVIKFGVWHSLAIATYQPRTDVFLDEARVMSYEDPQPLPAGTFALEAWLVDKDVKLLFDDIAICELTAPYKQ